MRQAHEEFYKAVCDVRLLIPSECYSYTEGLFIPNGVNKEGIREDMVFELGLEGWQNSERERIELESIPGRRRDMSKSMGGKEEKMGGKNNML